MVRSTVDVQLPQHDKVSSIFNVLYGLPAAQALLVAHELQIFELIAKNKALSLEAIAQTLNLQTRPAQALLSMCASLELLSLNADNAFEVTSLTKDFLLKGAPCYLGGSLDMTLMNAEVYTFKSFKQALLTNHSQVYQGEELFQTNEQQSALAKVFTRAMHGKSIAMAGMWPPKIDLSQNQSFLDIGGGSGAHSIGAVLQWPDLQAIVYDRPAVCEVAEEYIQTFDLKENIQTQVGDMWTDPFPTSDIHFYCDILHDWPLSQCRFLVEKSFEALPHNGRIIIHEMFFNENKTGPFSVASYNIMMLLWTQGQQLSKKELMLLLKEVGFIDIQVLPTGFGDWALLTGLKR